MGLSPNGKALDFDSNMESQIQGGKDQKMMDLNREATEFVTKLCGGTYEENEAFIAEVEKHCNETVRTLSMYEVRSAVATALIKVLGSMSVVYGPIIIKMVSDELFNKQEGE